MSCLILNKAEHLWDIRESPWGKNHNTRIQIIFTDLLRRLYSIHKSWIAIEDSLLKLPSHQLSARNIAFWEGRIFNVWYSYFYKGKQHLHTWRSDACDWSPLQSSRITVLCCRCHSKSDWTCYIRSINESNQSSRL